MRWPGTVRRRSRPGSTATSRSRSTCGPSPPRWRDTCRILPRLQQPDRAVHHGHVDFAATSADHAAQLLADELALDCDRIVAADVTVRSEEHTSELQSLAYLVCRLLLEK